MQLWHRMWSASIAVMGGNAGRRRDDKRRDMTLGLGLSIGATNVAAVARGAATTRQSVLTLYPHRPPEVGVPSENPKLAAPGLVVTGFVERAGDPVGVMAADGSFHRGEVLIADALRALTRAVPCGWPPVPLGVTYPAHWHASAASALRRELARRPEWAGTKPLTLIPDAAAALTALQAEPGLPTRGVVALCDVGGSGTSITLADAANGYRPIGATVRHADFSGEFVDRALLAHVIADLSIAGTADVAGTAAIASLHRLRAECRGAKERLSRDAGTALFAEFPGFRGEIRLTRSELDGEIRRPLAALVEALRELLLRNRIHLADLTAVATVGGGANIPAVTTTLSEQLRVPVVTDLHPELTAARGAAIRAARRPQDDSLTAVATALQPRASRARAWSERDDVPEIAPMAIRSPRSTGVSAARPRVRFVPDPTARAATSGQARYRPLLVTACVFAGMVLIGTGAVLAILSDASAPGGTATMRTATVAPEPTTQAAPPAVQTPPPVVAMAAPAPAAVEPPPQQSQPPPPPQQESPPPPLSIRLPPLPRLPLPPVPNIPLPSISVP
jgi:hypothetical protein